MAYGSWSSWNTTTPSSGEGSNSNGWNHCQTRYRVDTDTRGQAKVQIQIQARRTSVYYVGGSCYYASDYKATWDSGTISPSTWVAAVTMYDSDVNGGWKDVGTYTVTVTKAAGGTANFRYYSNCKWGMVDADRSFSLTIQPKQYSVKATAENATFDIKKGSSSAGNDVSSYEATWDHGTTYTISDIKAKSGYYLTETTTDTSGTITAAKTWTIAKAKKYITFKVTGTNVTFDAKLNGSVVADDKESYSNTSTKQGWSYSVYDIKKKGDGYILDSTNATSGTTSSSDITINAGVASPISFTSSVTYKSPIKVTSKCDINIDDKSGRTRNWYFVAKLKQGNTVLATLNSTTGTTKSCTLTFNRESTSQVLKVDTTYTVEWTVSDKTDTFGQSFTSTSTFTLPCLGYVVTNSSKKKISYFTITDATDAPTAGKVNYSFKRITKT